MDPGLNCHRSLLFDETSCFLRRLDLMVNSAELAQGLLLQSKNVHISHAPLIVPAISKQVRARMIILKLCFKDDEIEAQRSGRSFQSTALHHLLKRFSGLQIDKNTVQIMGLGTPETPGARAREQASSLVFLHNCVFIFSKVGVPENVIP